MLLYFARESLSVIRYPLIVVGYPLVACLPVGRLSACLRMQVNCLENLTRHNKIILIREDFVARNVEHTLRFEGNAYRPIHKLDDTQFLVDTCC